MPIHLSEMPDRPSLPITRGRLLDFPDDPAACMRALHRDHGDIAALDENGRRLHFAFGPHYNHRVLSDPQVFHARFFPIRGSRHSAQRRLTSGLLNMNGDEHKRHRRMVAAPFQKSSIANYRDGIATLAEEMIDEWKAGEVRDISRDMNEYMLRVTSGLLFGFDRHELAYEIGRATERWVRLNHEIGMGAFVADAEITASYGALLDSAEELESLIRRMIELRRATPAGNDVLSLLLQARDEFDRGMTDGELIGQAAVLFGAAHLTTAHTLTWALFLLAQHPRAASEVQTELRGGFRPGSAEAMPLLTNAVKESMRVLPASAYSQRIAAEPVDLGPFSLPKGAVVIFSPYISHHRAEAFPEPKRFLPNRWSAPAPPPYSYIPFAAGPRLCLGSSLAMMTIHTTLPTILRRFRLSVAPGVRIDAKVVGTMLTPTSGLPMLLSPTSPHFSSQPVEGNIHELVDLHSGEDIAEANRNAA